MAKVTVYHQMLSEVTGEQIVDNGCPMFVPVAEIEVGDMDKDAALEFAFRSTNNVIDSWSAGERDYTNGDWHDGINVLEPLKNGMGHRSSMVGDVFGFGTCSYKVAMCGFEKQA